MTDVPGFEIDGVPIVGTYDGYAWAWFGWTVAFGERQRWFVDASFGHSAASLSPLIGRLVPRNNTGA